MIRFIKNVWLFRKQLKRWRKDDWVYTEELLHKALKEMSEYMKPNQPELETVVDILDRRARWFYENYKLEGWTLPKFVIGYNDGLEIQDSLTDEQRKKNEEILQQQIDYRDSDFKFLLEQISLNADKWFL